MKKQLGFFAVLAIASGAMISSGLFILPGLAFARTGPAVFLSYLLAGLLALSSVMSLAELTTAMPRAGGDYFFVTRSFGSLLGTMSGLLSWFALSLKSAFAIIGIAELLFLSFGFPLTISALVLCLLFVILNLVGVKEATGFQVALVSGLLVILGIFLVAGFPQVRPGRFEPFLPHGTNALFSTAGFVFVSFGGLLTTASIAGEVRNPGRILPLALLVSLGVVTVIYTLVPFVVVGVLPPEQLADSLTPVADSARAVLGSPGFIAVTIASLLAFVTTANGGILTASRYPMALAHDQLLPPALAKVSRRSGAPTFAVLVTGVFIALSLILKLDVLVKAASTVILLTNVLANLSLIVLRESRVQNYRPSFRAPLYPWLQIISIALFLFLIVDMGLQPALFSILFVFAAVVIFFVYGRYHAAMEPALLHLMERITNRRLTTRSLQEELREIVFERDSILPDSFDEAIKRAEVLDIERPLSLEEFFHVAAKQLARSERCPGEEELVRLISEREAESSTAITPFAAVPHIILEGSGVFRLLLVRARKGIRFSDKAPEVKAVFILVGTRDTRNLHLRALAAIAQTLQSDGFEKRWLKAKSAEDLTDVILLSERMRG
jgi:amino acid transporter/mannitol/fructose-specific phosphotransferase system IIA component (Ntr-type)